MCKRLLAVHDLQWYTSTCGRTARREGREIEQELLRNIYIFLGEENILMRQLPQKVKYLVQILITQKLND